jgi:DNA repair photolyase
MILKAALPLFSSLPSVPEAPAVSDVKFRLRLPRLSPEARLRRAARRGGPVTLGSPAVPYEPAGRSPLAALEGTEGLEIAIVTRSPEIARELELLADLDRRCSVTVDLIVPAADAVLAWKLEPDGPAPRERLEAVARLAAEGIAVRVLCPMMAGVNDGEAALRRLLAAARDAGAWDVGALPASRHRLLPSLRPGIGDGGATFRRLRLEYGFPREMPGRG